MDNKGYIFINLLPYREQIRKEQIKQFSLLMGFFAAIAAFIVFVMYSAFSLEIESQNSRNEYIQKQNKKLDNDIKSIALLKDEINLLNNYKELQTIRFGEAIQIKTNINEANLQTLKTPYFSLLTLVENAIKHNTFTKEKPLVIEISNSNNFIEVTNNLQRKRNMGTTTKTGLTNLNERYKLIVNKEILVVVDEKYFTVKLPYINL